MGAEDSVEDVDEEEYRWPREVLLGPVRYTVRTRSLAHFEAPDGVLNFLGVGQHRFAGRRL
jgi:hypothetical protein